MSLILLVQSISDVVETETETVKFFRDQDRDRDRKNFETEGSRPRRETIKIETRIFLPPRLRCH